MDEKGGFLVKLDGVKAQGGVKKAYHLAFQYLIAEISLC
jgi:hypothetical protein